MRFGSREICDVVLRAKAKQTLGSRTFYKNEPVLYFDTLKTSFLEGAASTNYANGGKGNPRLIAWEGDKTLTFNMEDALLSPESFAILTGAGLIDATESKPIYVHCTSRIEVEQDNTIVVDAEVATDNDNAQVFIMVLDDNGYVAAEPCIPAETPVVADGKTTITCYGHEDAKVKKGKVVLVDYYVKKTGGVQQIEITADNFAGSYYLEASTLFRRESDGVDLPAEFVIPNGKIQSNFTLTMANSGDPSTFNFVMDAFPDYTKFDKTKKVLAIMQIIDEDEGEGEDKRQPCVGE